MKEPKIRFKGFSGEWKMPKLGDVFEIRNGYTPSKAVSAFWTNGTVPWFRMEDIRDKGGLLKEAYQKVTQEAVKGGGLFEANSILLATTATIGVHAMLIADSLVANYTPMYIYYSFFGIDEWCIKNSNAGGLLSVNMTELCKLPFLTPSLSEQRTLSSYFTSLDAQISASTSRLALLKQMKAASLQAMFPQEGETVPKVRFKGFEGEWKKVKLSECLEISTTRNLNNEYGVNEVLSVSDEEGVMNQIKLLGRSYAGKSVTNYKILRTNQVVYTKSPLKAKPYGIVKVNKGETGIVSVLYAVYDAKECVSPDYIHYYFEPTFRINNYLLPLINKGAKNTMNISDEVSLQGDIILPNTLEEQLRIVEYLQSLDRQIALHAKRLEKLKQIKAACLDKMFV